MTTGSICDDTEGKRSAGGAAEMARSDGMAGWTTSSAEEGGRTGLGEGERDGTERTWLGDSGWIGWGCGLVAPSA